MKFRLPFRGWLAGLRHARSNRAWVLAISAAFAILMGAAFYAAKDPMGLFRSNGDAAAKGTQTVKAVGLTGAGSLGGDDPVLRFNETKVGQVVFSSARSDSCRRVLFNNRTGERLEAGEVFCGQTEAQTENPETGSRLQSVSKSFQRQ